MSLLLCELDSSPLRERLGEGEPGHCGALFRVVMTSSVQTLTPALSLERRGGKNCASVAQKLPMAGSAVSISASRRGSVSRHSRCSRVTWCDVHRELSA